MAVCLLLALAACSGSSGASRGGKRARMTFAGDTAATLVGLWKVVALRHSP
ncbi:MAG: hypothetical protein M3450_01365 [Actinomycetota bacterium]|nr:hypothetical protein [Actinomycetota bacterium]